MDMSLDLLITDEGNYHKHKPNSSLKSNDSEQILIRKNNFLKEMSEIADNSIMNKNPEIFHIKRFINEKLNKLNNQKVKRNFKTKVTLSASFLKVGEIENIRQKFQAEA